MCRLARSVERISAATGPSLKLSAAVLLAPSISASTSRSLRMELRAATRSYASIAAQAHNRARVTVSMTTSRSLSLTGRFRYVCAAFMACVPITSFPTAPSSVIWR